MKTVEEIRARFAEEIAPLEKDINLARAALLIAQEEYLDLDVEAYLQLLNDMADDLSGRLGGSDDALSVIGQMNHYLFEEWGFTGNTEQYYDPKNSFLNQVIDQRTGIPMTLSVIYMEVGWRLGLPLDGIGFPGHFMVKATLPDGDIMIDPFNQGRVVTERIAQQILDTIYGHTVQFHPGLLAIVSKRQILTRLLSNLKGIYLQQGDLTRALAVIERMILLNPEDPAHIRDRGLICYGLEQYSKAYLDLKTYLQRCPTAEDIDAVRAQLASIRQRLGSLN
jgi:regulator of sirC expression with transglutaminase-like and TPR domain